MATEAEQLAAVLAWKLAHDEFTRAQTAERELRAAAATAVFGAKQLKAGTTKRTLADGRVLKAVMRKEAKVDQKKAPGALAKLRALGDAGALLADRLVKSTIEASVSEFEKLEPKHRRLFAGIITVGLRGPSLELVD